MRVEHHGLGIDLAALRDDAKNAHAEAARLRDVLAKYGRQEFLEHRQAFEAGFDAGCELYKETDWRDGEYESQVAEAWDRYYNGDGDEAPDPFERTFPLVPVDDDLERKT